MYINYCDSVQCVVIIICTYDGVANIVMTLSRCVYMGEIYTGVGKIGDFPQTSPFISETVRYRPMVTMER